MSHYSNDFKKGRIRMNRLLLFAAVGMVVCILFSGCQQYNVAYTPLVPDSGAQITTRNKYRIVDWSFNFKNEGLVSISPKFTEEMATKFASFQPGVFSSAGVPISVVRNEAQHEQLDSWGGITFLFPFLVSGTTLPAIAGGEGIALFEIKNNSSMQNASVKIHGKHTIAITGYSPIALIIPMSDEYETKPGYRTFHEHGRGDSCHVENQAIAYALAVKLKEMEDAGMVNSADRANAPASAIPQPANPVPPPSPFNKPSSVPPVNVKTPVPEKASEPAIRDTPGQVHEVENLTLQ